MNDPVTEFWYKWQTLQLRQGDIIPPEVIFYEAKDEIEDIKLKLKIRDNPGKVIAALRSFTDNFFIAYVPYKIYQDTKKTICHYTFRATGILTTPGFTLLDLDGNILSDVDFPNTVTCAPHDTINMEYTFNHDYIRRKSGSGLNSPKRSSHNNDGAQVSSLYSRRGTDTSPI